jgi:hypothetical protein
MKILILLAGLLLWAAPLLAETYSWEDETGTVNYTENYTGIPAKFRKNARKLGDMGASPVSKESVSPSTGSSEAPPAALKDTAAGKLESPVGNFDGRSYDQWKLEFNEREAAMVAIKKQVDEIDALLNKRPSNREQTQSLISERNKAVEQFTEMRKQYDQQVELARKAGVQVDITR